MYITSFMNWIIDATGHFSRPVIEIVLKFILCLDRGHECGNDEEPARFGKDTKLTAEMLLTSAKGDSGF